MSSIFTPNGVRCALRYTRGSLEAFNIIHATKGTPASGADLAALATIIRDWEALVGRLQRSNEWFYQGCILTALDGAGSPFLDAPSTPTLQGNIGAPGAPPQLTIAISLRTGLSGRSFRGRIYHIGSTVNAAGGDGTIDGAYRQNLQNTYGNLRDRFTAGGWTLCVLSQYSGKTPAGEKIPRAAGVLTPVLTVAVGTRCDTQRRRLPKEARA